MKLFTTILVLLARSSNMLERKVRVPANYISPSSSSSYLVRFCKLKTRGRHKKSQTKYEKRKEGGESHKKRGTKRETDTTKHKREEGGENAKVKKSKRAVSAELHEKMQQKSEVTSEKETSLDSLPPIEHPSKSKKRMQKHLAHRPRNHLESSSESASEPESDSSLSLADVEEIEEYEQVEKLIIVEEVPKEKVKEGRPVPLSIVTLEQFEELMEKVMALQAKFGKEKNNDMMRPTDFSDPMAAIQISRRIQSVEDKIQTVTQILKDLASHKPQSKDDDGVEKELKTVTYVTAEPRLSVIMEETSEPATVTLLEPCSSKILEVISKIIVPDGRPEETEEKKSQYTGLNEDTTRHITIKKEMTQTLEKEMHTIKEPKTGPKPQLSSMASKTLNESRDVVEEREHHEIANTITEFDLFDALISAKEDLLTRAGDILKGIERKNVGASENAATIERKLDECFKIILPKFPGMSEHIEEFEMKVLKYDKLLNVEMVKFQDFISQMYEDLTDGLENFELNLVPGNINELIDQTTRKIEICLTEIERAQDRQMKLDKQQYLCQIDLQHVQKMMQDLEERLANRDEVIERLNMKAGIRGINSIMTQEFFHSLRGSFEKEIFKLYVHINNMEINWAKHLIELEINLRSRSRKENVINLYDDIHAHISKLRKRYDDMIELLGEGLGDDRLRVVRKSDNCISCSSKPPNSKVGTGLPTISAPPIGDVAPTLDQDETEIIGAQKIRDICIPTQKIPHPLDSRARICSKYCGANRKEKHAELKGLPPISTTSLGARKAVQVKMMAKFPCQPCKKKEKVLKPPAWSCQCGDKLESRCHCHVSESELRALKEALAPLPVLAGSHSHADSKQLHPSFCSLSELLAAQTDTGDNAQLASSAVEGASMLPQIVSVPI